MKIKQRTYMAETKILAMKKLIQLKWLIITITGFTLSQNVLAEPTTFAYCGKKVVCQWDYTCTMIDGNYDFFKASATGTRFSPGTFILSKVVVYNKSRQAVCYYATPSHMSVQFWSLPNNRFGIAQFYPATEGWVYNDPDTVHSNGTNIHVCDASKFECRMEHWY